MARPDRISSPATRCSSRRFFGTNGLPSSRNNNNPIPGTKKINNNHAIADDGRRRSGTNPRTMRLIKMMAAQVSNVAIIESTRRKFLQPPRALSFLPADAHQVWKMPKGAHIQ